MKKFGFNKKGGDDDDPNRGALFGRKGPSQAPPSNNPYAQAQPANDPYMAGNNEDNTKYAPMVTPYQRAKAGLPGGPRPDGLPGGPAPRNPYGGPPQPQRGYSNDSSENPPPPYQSGTPSGGYGSDRYGASGGYGGNRYGDNGGGYGSAPNNQGYQGGQGGQSKYGGMSSRGPGGYGGLGGAGGNEPDENRDALFSGAQDRYNQRQTAPAQSGAYGQSGAQSGTDSAAGGYGSYGEQRELTEEEQEEAEVNDIKMQRKQVVNESLQSMERSLQAAARAKELGYGTYARLGAQGERLAYTETLLDKAGESTREAEDQTKKLRHLNRSMFAVHVDNPFTKKKRTEEMEARIVDQNRADREIREATRKAGYQTNARLEAGFKEIEATRGNDKYKPSSAAERNKYMFEADSDDERNEEQLDNYMGQLGRDVSEINTIAKLMGREIEDQNTVIDRLGGKSDKLNDAAKLNTERLRRIH